MPAEVQAPMDRDIVPAVGSASCKPPLSTDTKKPGTIAAVARSNDEDSLADRAPGVRRSGVPGWYSRPIITEAPADEATPVLHASPPTDEEEAAASPRIPTSAAGTLAAGISAASAEKVVEQSSHIQVEDDSTPSDISNGAPSPSVAPAAAPLPSSVGLVAGRAGTPGAAAPPAIKAMPSANSAFAIEVLQGLASVSPQDDNDHGAPAVKKPKGADEPAQAPLAATVDSSMPAPGPRLAAQPQPQQVARPAQIMVPPVVTSMPVSPYYPAAGGPPVIGLVLPQHSPQLSPASNRFPAPCTFPQQPRAMTPPPVLVSPIISGGEASTGEPRRWSLTTPQPPAQLVEPIGSMLPASATGSAPQARADVSPEGPIFNDTSVERTQPAAKRPRAKKGASEGAEGEAEEGKSAVTVTPWRPSEDSTILQGVAESGCKWSLIAQQLPGRSDNAVRNRWHRLEKAERQRREALQAGRPVEGYRCRKCGHFKKGHMCLGLETLPDATVQGPQPALSAAKRARTMVVESPMGHPVAHQLNMHPGLTGGPHALQHEYFTAHPSGHYTSGMTVSPHYRDYGDYRQEYQEYADYGDYGQPQQVQQHQQHPQQHQQQPHLGHPQLVYATAHHHPQQGRGQPPPQHHPQHSYPTYASDMGQPNPGRGPPEQVMDAYVSDLVGPDHYASQGQVPRGYDRLSMT